MSVDLFDVRSIPNAAERAAKAGNLEMANLLLGLALTPHAAWLAADAGIEGGFNSAIEAAEAAIDAAE